MANTPVNLIPYPIGSAIPDVPVDMKAMADRLEILISSKNPNLYNSGWITSTAHFAIHDTGWSVSAVSYRRVGSAVDVGLRLDYNGTSFTASSTGNVTDKWIATFNPLGAAISPSWAPSHTVAMAVATTGVPAVFCLAGDGHLNMYSTVPNYTVSTASAWVIQGSYLAVL